MRPIVAFCTIERRQNNKNPHDEIAENVDPRGLHFSSTFFLFSSRRCLAARRSHNNKRGYSKVARYAHSRHALSIALSLSLSLSRTRRRRVVVASSGKRSRAPRVLRLAGSKLNGRASAGGASPFVGRPPPLLTDKCYAARRVQSSVIKRPFAIIEANCSEESPPSPPPLPVDCSFRGLATAAPRGVERRRVAALRGNFEIAKVIARLQIPSTSFDFLIRCVIHSLSNIHEMLNDP